MSIHYLGLGGIAGLDPVPAKHDVYAVRFRECLGVYPHARHIHSAKTDMLVADEYDCYRLARKGGREQPG